MFSINLIQFMKKWIARKKINRIETMQHSVVRILYYICLDRRRGRKETQWRF